MQPENYQRIYSMPEQRQTDIGSFFVAGINYKKTDADLRGHFSVNKDQYTALFALAPGFNISEFFVISTCNRTEIYGFAQDASSLCELLCTQTQGSVEKFQEIAYVQNGEAAIRHLFNVASGLDSQILGDYEILGQLKQAVKVSKQHAFIGAYMERLVNAALQSSKSIKTNTSLSGGTVSVAFAAIQYIKEKVTHLADKKILLIGTGKIGRNTCKNLVDYLGAKNITLINRSAEKAMELAAELNLQSAPVENLNAEVDAADIILVATNADEPVILHAYLQGKADKLIIDLSIPFNVERSASALSNVTLVNVDDLSKIKDATLHKRQLEVPKAQKIIAEQMAEFLDWHQMRKNVPLLRAVKNRLYAMDQCKLYNTYSSTTTCSSGPKVANDYRIQKVINSMALKMRKQNQQGCDYINAINEYIAASTN